jgi:hypothetical protein
MQTAKVKIIKRHQIGQTEQVTIGASSISNGKPNISEMRANWLSEAMASIQARRQKDIQAFFGLKTEQI